jgi:hypothetical protein
MDVPMWTARQPCLDLRRLVGGIVIHHEVYARSSGHRRVDPLEEVEKLGRPLTFVAFPDHPASGNVERDEQRIGCQLECL